MLDYRIYTFLKLCEEMNYRKTAEAMNITQPAVTQHIHYLENEYQCKLFTYTDRKLQQTAASKALENYAKSAVYNNLAFRNTLHSPDITKLRIGATKTIGDYLMPRKLSKLLSLKEWEVTFIVDNTRVLLEYLENATLDIALIEGFFDKNQYHSRLMKMEKLIGICNSSHSFANKIVPLESLFKHSLLLREEGSGTRAAFEQVLIQHNYSINSFSDKSFVSSFELIKKCTLNNGCISFVYESIALSDPNLATFTIEGIDMLHEFHYVCLKDTIAIEYMDLLETL